jgi:hypothetical protein
MYAIDGIKYVLDNSDSRLFLSGSNNFIKYYLIDIIAKATNKIPNYVEKREQIKRNNLFGNSRYFNVFTSNANLVNLSDPILIKMSNKAASKKILKENSLTEIVCNDLFLNQVAELTNLHCNRFQIPIDKNFVYPLAYAYKDNLESLINFLNVGQFSDLNENLIDIPAVKLVNYFIEGNIKDFIRGFERTKEIYPTLWLLIKKFEELHLVLLGEKKYKSKFIANEMNRLALQFKSVNLNTVIMELYKIRENIIESGLNKNTLFLNHLLRLNLLINQCK